MSAPFYPGQPDYFDKLNEMDAGVAVAIEIGEGAAGAAASAAASASAAVSAKTASAAAAASATIASQSAASDAASAQILVNAVPPIPPADQMPWAVADEWGQPILGVTARGVVHAILDRLPGLDMLSGMFAHAVCDEDGYVISGVMWDGTPYPPVSEASQTLPGDEMLDGRFAYAYVDAQGVVVWGIQWDGVIYSFGQSSAASARAMVVRGDLWASGADGNPVQITQSSEASAPTVIGNSINFLSRVGGGFRPATVIIPESNAWASFVQRVLHILGYGQSLAMGASAAIFTSNPQCSNMLRTLGSGLRLIDQDAVLAEADCLPLKGLICSTPFESPLAQHAGQLQRNGGLPLATGIVASLHGRGGASLAQLAKGSSFYANAMTATRAVHADCVTQGLTHAVPYVDMIQGEADRAAAPGQYTLGLLQMQSDFDTDIRALTGQVGVVPMLLDQISNWTSYNIAESEVPFEQLEIARLYPKRFYCAGPKYWLQTVSDGTHLNSLSSRRAGAMHARAAEAVMAGVEWWPTHCIGASRTANIVTLKYYTPYGRLTVDTVNVGDPGNLGLRWVDSTNSATITNVRVNLDNTVTVTLSAIPTGANGYVGVADIGVAGAGGGPFTGPRACLRDSSTDKCFDNLPLFNWACHQRIPVI